MNEAQQRLEGMKSFLELIAEHNPQPQAATVKKPLLSIVTIYDEINESKWMYDFLENLPRCEKGKVELILCKTVRDNLTQEMPKPPETRNGIQIHHSIVYYPEWSFSDARNAAKGAASGDWILSLDTDEQIIQNQFDKLLSLIENADSETGAFILKIYSQIGATNEYTIGNVNRVFRNDERINYKCAIHESVMFTVLDLGMKSIDCNVTIFHAGYDVDLDALKKKLHRNLNLICREYARYNQSNIKDYLFGHLLKTVNEIERLSNEG